MANRGYDIAGNWERWRSKAGEWRSNEQQALADEMDRLRRIVQQMQKQLKNAEEAQVHAESRIVELRAIGAALREILVTWNSCAPNPEIARSSVGSIEHEQELLSTKQAAQMLGISPKTMHNWRVTGGGPAFVKIGGAVRYDRRVLAEWIGDGVRKHTSDPGRGGL